jgi:hypothetical protein
VCHFAKLCLSKNREQIDAGEVDRSRGIEVGIKIQGQTHSLNIENETSKPKNKKKQKKKKKK